VNNFDSAVVVGNAIGGFVGFPWLIAIGFVIARHPLGTRQSLVWLVGGALAAMGSVALWYVLVESEFGTAITLNELLASVLTTFISALIFRAIRRAKERASQQQDQEGTNAPNP
jgi:high-affinity Fe2+/Pb2+ permease